MPKRTAYIVLVATAVVVALIWGLRPRAINVDVTNVTRAALSVTLEEEGRTRVIDRFVISAPVAGFAERLLLKPGDKVAAGDVVARLQPVHAAALDSRQAAEAQARLITAKAGLTAARRRLEAAQAGEQFAQSEVQRLTPLARRELVSAAELDAASTRSREASAARRAANADVGVASGQLAAAEAVLGAAPANLTESASALNIRAPGMGRVLRVYHESEGNVSAGQALLEIGDPASLELVSDVLSMDAVALQPGMQVLVDHWGGDSQLTAEIVRVEPSAFTKVSALGVEEQRVRVISRFITTPASWQALGDQFRVELAFVLRSIDSALQVPVTALVRDGAEWVVYVVRDENAHRRVVVTGLRNTFMSEIVDGLDAGDTVVVHPPRSLQDGARVHPVG